MKIFICKVIPLILASFLLAGGCKKETTQPIGVSTKIIKVNLNEDNLQHLYSADNYGDEFFCKAYLAVFTSKGELLGLGSLTDSLEWEIRSDTFTQSNIEILLYDIIKENDENGFSFVNIHHYADMPAGITFGSTEFINNAFYEKNIDFDNEGARRLAELKSKKQQIPFSSYRIVKVEDFFSKNNNIGIDSEIFEEQNIFSTRKGDMHYYYPFIINTLNNFCYHYLSPFDTDDEIEFSISAFDDQSKEPYVYVNNKPESVFNVQDTLTVLKTDFQKAKINTLNLKVFGESIDYWFSGYNENSNGQLAITAFDSRRFSNENRAIPYVDTEKSLITNWTLNVRRNWVKGITPRRFYYSRKQKGGIPEAVEIAELSKPIFNYDYVANKCMITHCMPISSDNFKIFKITLSAYYTNPELLSYYYYYKNADEIGLQSEFSIPPLPSTISDEFSPLKRVKNWQEGLYSHIYSDDSELNTIKHLKQYLLIESSDSELEEVYSVTNE